MSPSVIVLVYDPRSSIGSGSVLILMMFQWTSKSNPNGTELPHAVRPCHGVGKFQLQQEKEKETAWRDRWPEEW